jgi:hypothetical protein
MIPPPFGGLLQELRDYSTLTNTLQYHSNILLEILYFIFSLLLFVHISAFNSALLLVLDLAPALVPGLFIEIVRARL